MPDAQDTSPAFQSQAVGIRLVDFRPFLHGSIQERKQTALAIDEALATDGFLYLCNHGIDQAIIDRCFEQVYSYAHQSQCLTSDDSLAVIGQAFLCSV
jgi:hypothetical protein